MEKNRKDAYCNHCRINSTDFERRCRSLRLKLEHSQHRVCHLETENARLRELVRIYKWQAASSPRPKPSAPNLPSELWREIFRLATNLEGPAFSHSNGGNSGREWKTSSTTRRSIPIVCRQWHSVGIEFLFERIVIQDPEQLHSLCTLINHLDPPRSHETLGWIRGVEIVLGPVLWDIEPVVNRVQEFLITHIPLDQLTLLGIDLLDLPESTYQGSSPETRFYKALEPMVPTILRCQANIQTLHFPGIKPHVSWEVLLESTEGSSESPLPRLESLSLLDGRWTYCSRIAPGSWSFSHLCVLFRTLRSVELLWGGEWMAKTWLALLREAPLLRTVFIGDRGASLFMKHHLVNFFRATPRLRLLTISIGEQEEFNVVNKIYEKGSSTHYCLQMVVIHMHRADAEAAIGFLFPLFMQIRLGNLPSLSKIVVHFRLFQGGCLDAWTTFPRWEEDRWAEGIQICATAKMELVNQDGDSLHLWRHRHDIGVELPTIHQSRSNRYEGEESIDDDTSISSGEDMNKAIPNMDIDASSSEEEWRPVSRGSNDRDYEPRSSDDSRITDDSEDEEYRYTFQPDLEPVHFDAVSESECLFAVESEPVSIEPH